MTSWIKKSAIMLLAFFAFQQTNAQTGTKILSIDSIAQLEPIIINDSTDFVVLVSVNDTSFINNDTISGDLFYYYRTDSMLNAGFLPRIINNDPSNITIFGNILDTVSIDIRPDEIRTSPPVNLIILWPAIITTNPEVIDSTQIDISVTFEGYIGIPSITNKDKSNIIFPVPANQFIYIQPTEINLIKEVHLLTVDGKLISTKFAEEISSGFIQIDHLPGGTYLIEINYLNGETIRTKVIKN